MAVKVHSGALGVPTTLWQEVPASLELGVPGQKFPILAVGEVIRNCSAERRNNLPSGRITAPSAGAAHRSHSRRGLVSFPRQIRDNFPFSLSIGQPSVFWKKALPENENQKSCYALAEFEDFIFFCIGSTDFSNSIAFQSLFPTSGSSCQCLSFFPPSFAACRTPCSTPRCPLSLGSAFSASRAVSGTHGTASLKAGS